MPRKTEKEFRGGFHETHPNLRLIVALTTCMYHSLMVLAMDFLSYDGLGLSIVRQDTINRSAS